MRNTTKSMTLGCQSFAVLAAISAMSTAACAAPIVLTIEVAGDLLEHGGVVTVYPIKASPAEWANTIAPNAVKSVRVEQRYAEIQLRYPANGTYSYNFRPAGAVTVEAQQVTFVLSIIGTDEKGDGPEMKSGFKDVVSSGGRVIRVPPLAEVAGEDEATRTNARWGHVEGIDPAPPADERSARSLVGIAGDEDQRQYYVCQGGVHVQVCTVAAERWPLMEMRWWRHIADGRLERLEHHALRRCFDSRTTESTRNCEPVPNSDEPEYRDPK